VAGVIAARTYNGIGLAGIAGGWQGQVGVRLIGLRIANNLGIWTEDRAKRAIDYLTWLRLHYGYTVIANMSIQTTGISDEPMPLFEASVNAAKNVGVIMVAAAGNMVGNPKSPYYQPEVETLPIPARYSGVLAIGASKDGATLQDELRSSYSLYDTEVNKLLLVAPVDDHVSSGIDIYTTYPGNDYVNNFSGTSAACPIAVGVVSLMLSINPSWSYSEISNIFASTAEKIGNYNYGSSGRTDEVGYGRINAYQALLLTLAYSNQSHSSFATAYNNGRRLIRDSNNRYHLVFESGSEIFYRRSNIGGTSWETPVRLSIGSGNNKYPSITGTSTKQFVVWQRYTGYSGGQYKYDTYFAKNTGSG